MKIIVWKHLWKYVWVKKCMEIREMLFKNWKLLFENTNQTEKVYASAFFYFFYFFYFLSVFLWLYATLVGPVHCSRDPQTSFFSNFDVKNRSHGIIHIFKNYFTIVFLIFSKKKRYLNTALLQTKKKDTNYHLFFQHFKHRLLKGAIFNT